MLFRSAHRLLNTACAASGDKLIFTGVALEGYGSTVAYDPSASVWEGIGYEPITSVSGQTSVQEINITAVSYTHLFSPLLPGCIT